MNKSYELYRKYKRLNEEELTQLQQDYRDYFSKMMELYRVKDPSDFTDEKKQSEFFDNVNKNWNNGKGVITGWEEKVKKQLGESKQLLKKKLLESKLRKLIQFELQKHTK